MLGVTLRRAAPIVLAGIAFACIFVGGNSRREFGPNDPIAADGSNRSVCIHTPATTI